MLLVGLAGLAFACGALYVYRAERGQRPVVKLPGGWDGTRLCSPKTGEDGVPFLDCPPWPDGVIDEVLIQVSPDKKGAL